MKKSIFLFFAAILCAMSANATTYYYKGQRHNDWATAVELKTSDDTYYSYIYFAAGSEHEFKIVIDPNSWDVSYGKTFNSVGFNGTDVTELGDNWGGDNCKIWSSKAHYVLVYHPNTVINNTNKPIICASTFLPNDAPIGSDPVITVTPSALDFGYVELNQTKTLTTTYTLENISEEANISVSGEGFTAVDNEGTISVTFAPTTEGDYTGTLTVTAGETSKEVSLSAKGVVTHEITVKAKYPAGWNAGKAAVHFWGDGVTGATPAAMTKDGDWWSYTVTGVPTTSELSVIFINGETWNGDANQTVDITGITESTCYQVTDGSGKASAEKVDCEGTPSTPEPEPTELTYSVTVPEGTNACYIVGDMTSWTSFKELTKVDATHYTITIEGAKKTDGYKYTSGADWSYVEKDASGNEIGNRTYVDGNDVVARWAAVFDPDAVEQELTYSVTVPAGTYACYIAMDTDPAQEGWEFNEMTKVDDTHYTFTRTGLKNKTYKYTCGEGWEYVEKTAEDGDVADRTWAENDVVAKWASVYNPTAPTYDYYIAGTLAGGWSATQQGMEKDGELYKAIFTELNAGEYEFKITDGQWNTNEDKTHEWGYSNLGAAYEEVSEGTDGEGNPNGNIKFVTEEAKNITVIFDATANKITLVGLTEKAPEPTFDYYICGSFNSNNPKNAENGMTLDGEVYKATVTLAEGDNTLKVTDGTWDKTWGYSNLGAAYDEVSDAGEYNNIKITLAAEAEKNITVIFNATTGKVTFDGLTPYVAPLTYTVTVPAGTEKCYIAGAFAQSNWNTFVEMTKVGDEDKFTIDIVGAKETDQYKYACQADWAYAEVIDGGGNRTNWSELDEVTAWNKPVIYTYYLMGVNDDWTTGIEMTENPDQAGEYMLTCQPVNGQVKIKRVGDDASEYWFGGKSLKEDPANLGTNTEAATDGDGNIELAAGKYNFYFDTKAEKQLWIAAATDCAITLTTGDNSAVIAANIGKTVDVVIDRSFTANDGYYTLCVPFNMPASVIGKAYSLGTITEHVAGEGINIELQEENMLSAGMPYLVLPKEDMDKLVVENVTILSDGAAGQGTRNEELNVQIFFQGYYSASGQTNGSTEYWVGNNGDLYNEVVDIRGLCGLFTITDTEGNPAKVRARVVTREDAATGFENITNGENTTIKLIENGQLIIIRNGEKFNAQGQKL